MSSLVSMSSSPPEDPPPILPAPPACPTAPRWTLRPFGPEEEADPADGWVLFSRFNAEEGPIIIVVILYCDQFE